MKAIQIYSASFSGSTMLDLMLGNGEGCLSCGEIYALFRPFDERHEADQGVFWENVREKGEDYLYSKLRRFGYHTIIDSSKNFNWYQTRLEEAKELNLPVYKICIFKSPEEWAWSVIKRRNLVSMDTWTYIHSIIIHEVNPQVYVEYRTLAEHPAETLRQICEQFEVNYFDGKERYWETENTQLFGNNRARESTGIEYHVNERYPHFNNKTSTYLYKYMQRKALKITVETEQKT